jgi:MATE family multidrug resistance protein
LFGSANKFSLQLFLKTRFCLNNYTKDIIKISWPIIIGQLGMVLTGFFDTLMVGDVGHHELAAAVVCNSIFFFVAIFPMGVTMAYATIVGILQGKNKTTSYRLLLKDSFITTIALSLICILILYVFILNFDIFKQDELVAALSTPYLALLTWSLAPMLIFFFAKNICDGFSYTMGGMIITLAALVINVFLNWVLIDGHLGFPAYGLNGAGYATIISRVFLAISMLLVMFQSSKIPVSFMVFWLTFSEAKRIRFYKKIMRLGMPTGLQYFLEIAAFAAAAILAGTLGAREAAAHGLAITLASLTYMFAGGISAGSSICVAKAYGNGNMQNVKNYGINGHKLGFAVMVVFALIFALFNENLASLFSTDETVISMGSQLLLLAAIFQLGDGIQAVSVGLLRGVEDTIFPSILIFIAYWVIAMPIGYYLSWSQSVPIFFQSINGIWIGLSLGLTASAIALTYRFYYVIRTQ